MKSIEAIKATINKGKERINKLQEENHENDFSLEIAKVTLDMAKNEFILAVTQGISINRLETICNAERDGNLEIVTRCKGCVAWTGDSKDETGFCACANYEETTKDHFCGFGKSVDESKLEVLNKIEVVDYSCCGEECEYVIADITDENEKILQDGGFTEAEITKCCVEDYMDLSYLAFNHTSACCWLLQDGFF